MKFGTLQTKEAEGAILAHGVKCGDTLFKKGRILSAVDLDILLASGIQSVIAARLDPDDVAEDIAARQVAVAACGAGAIAQQAFTGRANLHSSVHGLLVLDQHRIRALNHLHESLTLATLANHAVVTPKQMVATIKVIPFAVPRQVLEQAMAIIGNEPLLKVASFQPKRAGLIITRLPQTKPSIITKSESAICDRLAAMGATLSEVATCDHDQASVQQALAALASKPLDLILVFGASAIVDRADVIPAALVEAGGRVIHVGMPVDPGNLLMLGEMGSTPVIGVPSCARSPKVNGFDWVLERVVANLPVTREDIMDMGAGGLLGEIASRPSPREQASILPASPRVAAIVLAAGKSTRMGSNKMLALINGKPMIRATLEKITASSVDDIVVVTGNEREQLESAVQGIRMRCIHNPHFAEGLSTSLRKGLEAVAETADAVIICLGDMPLIAPELIDRLVAAFNPVEHRTIVVPVHQGQFGNPVLWGREHFVRLMALEGDRGARSLIEQFKSEAIEITAGDDSVLKDADTPEALDLMAKG